MLRADILKSASGTTWGPDRKMLSNLYTALIRSKLYYGAMVYKSDTKQILIPLEEIQNSCLRVILSA